MVMNTTNPDIVISIGEVVSVTDVLIRGLSDEAVSRIDAEAAFQGLSRNEFLRRKLEQGTTTAGATRVTAEDWERSAQVFKDLADPDVMDAAWR